MIMQLPIQDRRSMIQRHNAEQNAIDKEYSKTENSSQRTYEGELLNTFAKKEQSKKKEGF